MKTIAVKIVILGSQGVGKTSLMTRYETNSFQRNISSTIGASFSNVEQIMDGTKVKMQVWDTAGQERFRSMAPMYYRGANAALLVFDLTNYETFTDVKSWAYELISRLGEELLVIVVGNKMDLTSERAVDSAEAREYAASIGATFIETSALDNTGVKEMFEAVAREMVHQAKADAGSSLRVYSPDGKSSGWEEGGPTVHLEEADGGGAARGGSCC